MKIVAGLGNPGRDYAGTPHNIGFAVVDELATRLECAPRRSLRFSAAVGRADVRGEAVLLVKPATFMNRSGDAVAALLRYHKVALQDLIVVMDDADLPLGRLRVRVGGGSGGHRGLDSILAQVNDGGFVRVRLGIGRRGTKPDLVEHVLSPFGPEEAARVRPAVSRAADAVLCAVESGPAAAMNRFNGLEPPDDGSEVQEQGEANGNKREIRV